MPKGEGLARYNLQRAQKLASAVFGALRSFVLEVGESGARWTGDEKEPELSVALLAERANVKPMEAGLVLAKIPRAGVTRVGSGRGARVRVNREEFLELDSDGDLLPVPESAEPSSTPAAEAPALEHDQPLALFKPKYPTMAAQPKTASRFNLFNPFGL